VANPSEDRDRSKLLVMINPDGLFFVDRLSPAKRFLLLPKLKRAFRHR